MKKLILTTLTMSFLAVGTAKATSIEELNQNYTLTNGVKVTDCSEISSWALYARNYGGGAKSRVFLDLVTSYENGTNKMSKNPKEGIMNVGKTYHLFGNYKDIMDLSEEDIRYNIDVSVLCNGGDEAGAKLITEKLIRGRNISLEAQKELAEKEAASTPKAEETPTPTHKVEVFFRENHFTQF